MSRIRKRGMTRKLGELERYGMVALLGAFLLTLAYLHEELRRKGAPRKAERFVASLLHGGTQSWALRRSEEPTKLAHFVGTGSLLPAAAGIPERRPDFDFFEPPVRLPGEDPAVVPSGDGRPVQIFAGDTLAAIAERELGSSQHWREILAVNPGIDPRRLVPGQWLQLPQLATYLPDDPLPEDRTAYTVGRNDTLQRISQKFYGTPHRWLEILEANRSSIASPEKLRVGTVLRIP